MADKPYKDADRLRELYHGENLSSREVAERMDCDKKTILRWLENHGIVKNPQGKTVDDKRLYDYEWLENQYVTRQRSTRDIANELGCGKKAVIRHLERAGVDRRDTSEATSLGMDNGHCGFHTSKNGYEMATTRGDERAWQVGIHRLIAIANGADPYELFTRAKHTGKHVHHDNAIPWDNRPENIEVLSQSDHQKEHMDDFTRDEKGRVDGVDRS
jgi:transposase-like protein